MEDWRGQRPAMKITAITPYLVRATEREGGAADRPRGRNWLFVAVETDAGVTGVGEGGGWPELVEAGVREVAPLLLGDNPLAAERTWLKIYDALHGHGLTGAVRGGVLSAIDMALWDIKGKALGVPVYELLGGAVHDRIRVYGHASTVEQARGADGGGLHRLQVQPLGEGHRRAPAGRRRRGRDRAARARGVHRPRRRPPGPGRRAVPPGLLRGADQPRPPGRDGGGGPEGDGAPGGRGAPVPQVVGLRDDHQRVDRPLPAGDDAPRAGSPS